MYKPRYTFWYDKNFPGFTKALSKLYDRSIRNAKATCSSKEEYVRSKFVIDRFMDLIEFYYVSILKLGYVTKSNYSNILERMKSINTVISMDSEKLNGLTSNNDIYINPNPDLLYDYNIDEMFRMNSYHELGHIISMAWDDDLIKFSDFLYTYGGVSNRLKTIGLDKRKNIIDGLLLLNEVSAQDAAEEVLSRDINKPRKPYLFDRTHTQLFPGLKYNSNLCLYAIFQEIAYDFMKCFKFSGMSDDLSFEENSKRFNKCLFDRNFINNMFQELYMEPEKIEDYAVMLAGLGSVKNAVYSLFDMGTGEDNRVKSRLAFDMVKNMEKLYKVNNSTMNNRVI